MEWINYKCSEVRDYHPICEKALNKALKNLKLSDKYEIVHHKVINKLEMDYIILNQNTKKILCVIEVKRTPSDIHSSRYQYQALNYVLNASEICEKPYYILTNLEYAFLFRYEEDRGRPYNQMLEPGLIEIAKFKDYNEHEFIEELTKFYEIHIDNFIKDNYKYSISLKDFNEKMIHVKRNEALWKSTLVYLLYEYIRGAFVSVGRRDLKDIRRFGEDIKSICDEAIDVNFDGIFNHNDLCDVEIKNNLLNELYELGNKNMTGDDIAQSLHEIVSDGEEHNGEVSTDMELARILSIIAKQYIEKNNPVICDPAAGSGNLISAAIKVFNTSPRNIICNDKNSMLIQLLSLRLGLGYVETIESPNTPNITNENIADLGSDYFKDTDLIVLNPPFVSGLYSMDRKNELYNKIKNISGEEALSKIGQIGLEIPFLETLNIMAPKETVFGIILPLTYLFGRGPEGVKTRELLLNNFGLKCIFTFPKEGAFDDVSKATCILIGSNKFINHEYVEVYSSYDKIADLNLDNLIDSISTVDLESDFKDLKPGIEGRKISKDIMKSKLNEGWRNINGELTEAISFVNNYIEKNDDLLKLKDLEFDIVRGNAGNTGGSNLVFKSWDFINEDDKHLYKPGFKNSKHFDEFKIGKGDFGFLYYNQSNLSEINKIIKEYINIETYNGGRQGKNIKNFDDLSKIIKRDSKKVFNKNSLLIPRAIRANGKVYMLSEDTHVSTNFIIIKNLSEYDSIVIGTWMTTIFYQLNCEVQSKDQEGMRKMEKIDIMNTYVPNIKLQEEDYNKLKQEVTNIKFLNLKDPEVREIDRIWAKIIFKNIEKSELEKILKKSNNLLKNITRKRNQ